MKKWLFIIILLFSSCASNHPWTRGDSIRQGVALAAIGIDWMQTRKIAMEKTSTTYTEHSNGSSSLVYNGRPKWNENNPLLGKHPSIGRVNAYFLGSMIGNTAIAYFLPSGWRESWQYLTIGWEGAFITINFNHGIKP